MDWPYRRIEFTKAGAVADPAQRDDVRRLARPGGRSEPTDVLLVAHGWNNDVRDAERLFTSLCDNVADLAARRGAGGHRWAVVGLVWPAVRWADEGQLAGGGLSAGGELPLLLDAIGERVEDAAAAAELRTLAGQLEVSDVARDRFVELLRDLLPPDDQVRDDDRVPLALRSGHPGDVLDTVAEAERDAEAADTPGPAAPEQSLPPGMVAPVLTTDDATAAGLSWGDLNPTRLARQLLNLTTYYTMKARAGDVGTRGVAQLIEDLGSGPDAPRLHLAGHSFGARVVTAAATATNAPVSSVTLLQGAFSHRGFSGSGQPPGAFRGLLEGPQLRGPVVVTHTHHDKAVMLAYAMASRLARQAGSAIGDAEDPYGGLGANGAVATAEADRAELGDEHTTYAFRPRRVTNLLADRYVAGHSDVTNRAVANALLQSMLTVSEPAGSAVPSQGAGAAT